MKMEGMSETVNLFDCLVKANTILFHYTTPDGRELFRRSFDELFTERCDQLLYWPDDDPRLAGRGHSGGLRPALHPPARERFSGRTKGKPGSERKRTARNIVRRSLWNDNCTRTNRTR